MLIRRPQDIGAMVRSARISNNLSQQQLADRLGVSRLWVIELEGGKATARLDLVLRTLNELEINLVATADADDVAQISPPSSPPDFIDIDDIAETGLERPKRSIIARSKRPR